MSVDVAVKRLLVASVVACVAAVALHASSSFSQGGTQIYVDPPTQTIGAGSTVDVTIKQSAGVVTIGAQATVLFNPAVLQIVNVQLGAPYAEGDLVAAEPLDAAIATANATGAFSCVAAFLIPGTGAVEPGDQEFMVLTMQAVATGVSPIEISDAPCGSGVEGSLGLLDESGGKIQVTAANGSVSVETGAPVSQVTPGSPAPQSTFATGGSGSQATPESTVLGDVRVPTIGTVSTSVSPASVSVAKGEDFSLDVMINSSVPVTAAEVDVAFNKNVMQIVSIEPGPAWQEAAGGGDSELASTISEANEGGKITNFGLFLTNGSTVPAGEQTFVTLHMRASQRDGASDVTVSGLSVTDDQNNEVTEASVSAGGASGGTGGPDTGSGQGTTSRVTVGSGKAGGGGAPWLLIVGIVLAIIAVGGTTVAYVRRRQAWA